MLCLFVCVSIDTNLKMNSKANQSQGAPVRLAPYVNSVTYKKEPVGSFRADM